MAEIPAQAPQISTQSLDEATVLRASGHTVTVVKKACAPRALFYFDDSPATRALLDSYHGREIMPIPPRVLLITRGDLYREARVAAARGGL